ncbi:MAG: hypothetical protein LAP13_27105 [Acidobacteriia bacterium]|nr:hypothetical protein [Terriglobia bacterium]
MRLPRRAARRFRKITGCRGRIFQLRPGGLAIVPPVRELFIELPVQLSPSALDLSLDELVSLNATLGSG